MLRAVWTRGTCLLGGKIWAVVPLFYLLFKKPLPEFVPRVHSCPRVGPLGVLPATISAVVRQTAVSRRRRRKSVHIWAVDSECRCSTRSVFGLWTLSVGSAI